MKITHTMVVMFIGSVLIQYFLMSPVMVNNRIDITNNLGKVYISVFMALLMVLMEVMMHDHQYNVLSSNTYIIIGLLIAIFVYLYRNQVAIKDTQYLEGMIEHHSMAILTSTEILKKTNNYDVARLAKNIIQKQEDEIRDMREILMKLK